MTSTKALEAPYQQLLTELEREEKQLRERLRAIAVERANAHAQVSRIREAALEPLREKERAEADARAFERLVDWAAENPRDAREFLRARQDELQRHQNDGNAIAAAAVEKQIARIERAIDGGNTKRRERRAKAVA